MDFTIKPEIQAMRDQIERFLEEKIYPIEKEMAEYDEHEFPKCAMDHPKIRALQKEAQDIGLWAGHLPEEAGGLGLSVRGRSAHEFATNMCLCQP